MSGRGVRWSGGGKKRSDWGKETGECYIQRVRGGKVLERLPKTCIIKT